MTDDEQVVLGEYWGLFTAFCNRIFDQLRQSCYGLTFDEEFFELKICDISEPYIGGFWKYVGAVIEDDPFISKAFEPLWREKIFDVFVAISSALSAAMLSLDKTTDLQRFLDSFIENIKKEEHIFDDIRDDLTYRCEAQMKIAAHWRRASADPKFRLCRDRLAHEFSQL